MRGELVDPKAMIRSALDQWKKLANEYGGQIQGAECSRVGGAPWFRRARE